MIWRVSYLSILILFLILFIYLLLIGILIIPRFKKCFNFMQFSHVITTYDFNKVYFWHFYIFLTLKKKHFFFLFWVLKYRFYFLTHFFSSSTSYFLWKMALTHYIWLIVKKLNTKKYIFFITDNEIQYVKVTIIIWCLNIKIE